MLLFGMIFLIVALLLIGAGLAVGLIISLGTIALVGLGVLSSSVAIGICARNAQAGLHSFLVISGVLGGIPSGMLCAEVLRMLFEPAISHGRLLVAGACSGAASGLMLAMIVGFVMARLGRWIDLRALSPKL